MSRIPSFPKIFNLGHDAIDNLFKGEVEITEKVDGSQFRFGIDSHDELVFGSKGAQLFSRDQNGMFSLAVDQVEVRHERLKQLRKIKAEETGNPDIELFFYGEYLQKPKHNVLAYERTPKDNIILFSVKVGQNFVNNYDEIVTYGNFLGFEVVPLLYRGILDAIPGLSSINENGEPLVCPSRYEFIKAMISNTTSKLGNQIIEGVVIKNYKEFHFMCGSNPSPCFGKYVREDFKEKLHKEWGQISGKSALQEFIDGFRAEARWQKAVQHLRDKGELENSPRDIGKLMKEVHTDIIEEESLGIKAWLYNYFVKDIKRKATAGLPEWYKDQLLKKQCDNDTENRRAS